MINAKPEEELLICTECSFPIIKIKNVAFLTRNHVFFKSAKQNYMKKKKSVNHHCRGCDKNLKSVKNNKFTRLSLDKCLMMSMNNAYTGWIGLDRNVHEEAIDFPYGCAKKQQPEPESEEEKEEEKAEIDDGWGDDYQPTKPAKPATPIDDDEEW